MTPPEEYEARLDKLVTRLRQTNAKLIWASTTCCTNVPMRRNGDDVTYNAIAARIMMKHDVPIDDLHALTSTFTPELFMSPGNVHYSKEGYRKIGQQVAEAIEKALKD
jgi:lysophospholipase L1-like esterase